MPGETMMRKLATYLVVLASLLLVCARARAGDTVYYYLSDALHSEVVITDQKQERGGADPLRALR